VPESRSSRSGSTRMCTAIAIRKPLERHSLTLAAMLPISKRRALAEHGRAKGRLAAPTCFLFNPLWYGRSDALIVTLGNPSNQKQIRRQE
jgi:hypothetical protein